MKNKYTKYTLHTAAIAGVILLLFPLKLSAKEVEARHYSSSYSRSPVTFSHSFGDRHRKPRYPRPTYYHRPVHQKGHFHKGRFGHLYYHRHPYFGSHKHYHQGHYYSGHGYNKHYGHGCRR